MGYASDLDDIHRQRTCDHTWRYSTGTTTAGRPVTVRHCADCGQTEPLT